MTVPIHLEEDYLLLAGTELRRLDGGEQFWEGLANDDAWSDHIGSGWLVAAFPATADWTSWEMHPHADEVVHVSSGQLVMTLDRDGNHESITVGGGETVIVPAGVWHTVDVEQPGAILTITHGHGTDHRPR